MFVGLPAPFAGQAGLADAWFARDQYGSGAGQDRLVPVGEKLGELAGAPDERARSCEHRGHRRPLDGRIACRRWTFGGLEAQLEDVLGPCEVLQLAHAEVDERDVVGQRVDDQLGGRTRTQGLST